MRVAFQKRCIDLSDLAENHVRFEALDQRGPCTKNSLSTGLGQHSRLKRGVTSVHLWGFSMVS